jgi:internalin A
MTVLSAFCRRRREFLSNVRFTFDSLHQYITGVKPKEMVPIPGHPEVEPVPYQFLLTLEKNRVEQQFFPGMMEPISVNWLLDGV